MVRVVLSLWLMGLFPLPLVADLVIPGESQKTPTNLSRSSPEQDLTMAIAGLLLASFFAVGGLWLIWRSERHTTP